MNKGKKGKGQIPHDCQTLMNIVLFCLCNQFPTVSILEFVCSLLANDHVPLNSVSQLANSLNQHLG